MSCTYCVAFSRIGSLTLVHSVTKDVSPPPNPLGVRGGAFDGRRATVIDEVFTETANKITPPVVSVPPLQPAT